MKIWEYLKQPATLLKVVVWVFALGVTWSTLNYWITTNDKRLTSIEAMHYDVTIMQMQTDIAWIRKALEK